MRGQFKEPEKDGVIEFVCKLACIKEGFELSNYNQHKPSECKAHVHIPQQSVIFEYFAMQQTLHENFADSVQRFDGKQIQPDLRQVTGFEATDPFDVPECEQDGQYDHPRSEWNYKQAKVHGKCLGLV